MSLVPLSSDEVAELISVDTTPTAAQYAAYWGRTPRERYNRLLETLLVSILGVVFSYCLSFVLGGFAATLLGTVFLFWGIFSPQLQAMQRNWEFLSGQALLDYSNAAGADSDTREREKNPSAWLDLSEEVFGQRRSGLYGALFLGRLDDVCVVEYSGAPVDEEYDLADFSDYTMERDDLEQYTGNPYLLRVRLADAQGRQLQIHTRLSEEYLDFVALEEDGPNRRRRLGVVALLLSHSPRFEELAALSDLYVPFVQKYIGDYPYLHRDGIEYLLATDDDIWNALLHEQEQIEAIASGENEEEPSPRPKRQSNARSDWEEEQPPRPKVRTSAVSEWDREKQAPRPKGRTDSLSRNEYKDDEDENDEDYYDDDNKIRNSRVDSASSQETTASWNPSVQSSSSFENDEDDSNVPDLVPVRRRRQRATRQQRRLQDWENENNLF